MVGWCLTAGAPRGVHGSPSEDRFPVTTVRIDPASSARPYAFTRAQRLLSPAEFARVFKSGRRRSDACLTVIAAPGAGPPARLGLAVSKKVSKSAVQRNRIKRLVRESFRQRSSQLSDLDIVVMARPGAAQCDNAGLTTSIDAHLEWIARTCEASRSS